MATVARTGSKPLWMGALLVLTCLWFLLHSSSISNPASLVSEPLSPAEKETEPHAVDITKGDIFRPGEAIPASAWENGYLRDAPNNELYEAGSAQSKKEPAKTKTKILGDADLKSIDYPGYPEPALTEISVHRGSPKAKKEDRPLILYAYYESEFARENLKFFVDHGLHSAADFIFILNGETDVDETIIFRDDSETVRKYDKSNIMVRRRENTCFDLGAHAEVLNGVVGGVGWSGVSGPIPSLKRNKRALKDRYKRYILMNASIRGPFVPLWSNSCWSDAYLNKVTDKIKLVGMSYNCHTDRGHVQSMIWATDSVGLSIILTPAGISECFADMPAAQNGEIRTTPLLRDHGYDVDVFLSVYHSKDKETEQGPLAKPEDNPEDEDEDEEQEKQGNREALGTGPSVAVQVQRTGKEQESLSVPGNFWKSCTDEDWLGPGSYFGTFVHPYENLFMKSHRHIEDTVMDRLTEWHNGWGYSSYDVCF